MFIIKKWHALIFTVFLMVFSLAACTEKKDAVDPTVSESPVPAESFVIALLPKRNVFEQKRRYKPLEDYLSKALRMNVRTRLLDSYEAVYGEMLNNRVDAAVFGSLSYVVTDSKIPLVPVARPRLKDGTSTYSGLILVHNDSGITENVSTWRGKRIALVNKSTTSGYIFPRWYLQRRGITDFEGYFSKVIYTGSHDAAIVSLIENEADIGCASDDVFNDLLDENLLLKEKLKVIARSAGVPLNVIGIKKSADPGLIKLLKESLLGMAQTAEGRSVLSSLGAVEFIDTKKSDFDPLMTMLEGLGVKPGEFALDAIAREQFYGAPGESGMK